MRLTTDAGSLNKLGIDPVSKIQAVIICGHVMQHGSDPTILAGSLNVPFVTLSLDTVALYSLKAVWEQVMDVSATKAALNENVRYTLRSF